MFIGGLSNPSKRQAWERTNNSQYLEKTGNSHFARSTHMLCREVAKRSSGAYKRCIAVKHHKEDFGLVSTLPRSRKLQHWTWCTFLPHEQYLLRSSRKCTLENICSTSRTNTLSEKAGGVQKLLFAIEKDLDSTWNYLV